jgi:hypothetical protein
VPTLSLNREVGKIDDLLVEHDSDNACFVLVKDSGSMFVEIRLTGLEIQKLSAMVAKYDK